MTTSTLVPLEISKHGPESLVHPALELLRVGSAAILLLYSFGYVSALWAWVCVPLPLVALVEFKPFRAPFTRIDYAVVGVWLFAVISIPLSSFPSNSWLYVEQVTIASSLYFSLSRFRSKVAISLLALFVCGLACVSAVPDLLHFLDRYSVWTELKFGSITDVRQSLTIVGSSPTGAHYTIYLFFLAVGSAFTIGPNGMPRWVRWLGAVTLCAGLAGTSISLSRGIGAGFIAGTCWACLMLRLGSRARFRLGRRATAIAITLAVLGIGLLLRFTPPERFAATTANFESADRSSAGRFFLWKKVIQMARDRPWLGFGAHTFVLYGATGITQDGDEAVDRAYSFPVQLFFEQGFAGVIIYASLFAIVLCSAFTNLRGGETRSRSQLGLSWAAAGLVAILVRDLTYTTLFDERAVTTGTFVLIAMIAWMERWRAPDKQNDSRPAICWRILVAGVVVALGIVVVAHRVRRGSAEWYSAEAVQADSERDYKGALQHSLRALAVLPDPYLRAQAGLFHAKSAGIALGDGGRPVLAAEDPEGLRQLVESEALYQASVDAFPREAAWQHNLGWLLWLKGDRPSALQKLRQAVDLEPGTALYRQSLILLLIDGSALASARDEIVTLLTIAPEVVDSPWWEGITVGQTSTARLALQLAIDRLASPLHASPITLARQARLCLEIGDISSADLLLKQSLRQLPAMSGAWRNYGLIQARRSQWDQSTESLERAVYLDPWDSGGYYALSQAILRTEPANKEESQQMRRASDLFQAKAARLQTADKRSVESMRAYRKFQEISVPDDLTVGGLLEFCTPRPQLEYKKIMQ